MIDDPMLYNFYTVSIIDYFSDLTVKMLVIVNILVFACACVASAFPLPYWKEMNNVTIMWLNKKKSNAS